MKNTGVIEILCVIGLVSAIFVCLLSVQLFIERDDFKPRQENHITFDSFQDSFDIEYNEILHKNDCAYYLNNGEVVLIRAKNERGIKFLTQLK